MPAPHPKLKVENLEQNESFTTLCLPLLLNLTHFGKKKSQIGFEGDVVSKK